MNQTPFSIVLELAEQSGAQLMRIQGPWRVFRRADGEFYPIEVRNGQVDTRDLEGFQAWLRP